MARQVAGLGDPLAALGTRQGLMQGGHAGADAMHGGDGGKTGMAGHIEVQLALCRAQFQHVAQNGDAAPPRDAADLILGLGGDQHVKGGGQ